MSYTLSIFVDSYAPLEEFVDELQSISGFTFQRMTDEHEVWYEFDDLHINLTAGRHELENDRGMTFEAYPYQITVRVFNYGWEERKKQCDAVAWSIYNKLKATDRYALMLVEDLQVKLEEYHPEMRVVG